MAFYATSMIFDGVPCESYGLRLYYTVSGSSQTAGTLGGKIELVGDQIARRSDTFYYGQIWNEPLEQYLILGVDHDNGRLDRVDLAAISYWLMGHSGYRCLDICQEDMTWVRYHCKVTQVEQIELQGAQIGVKVSVICDSPFAYQLPVKQTIVFAGSTSAIYRNESNVRRYYCPKMTITLNGTSDSFSLQNRTDGGRAFQLTGLPLSPLVIQLDGLNQVMTCSTGLNLYEKCNLLFPRFLPGRNDLVVTGDGSLVLDSEFQMNVGA